MFFQLNFSIGHIVAGLLFPLYRFRFFSECIGILFRDDLYVWPVGAGFKPAPTEPIENARCIDANQPQETEFIRLYCECSRRGSIVSKVEQLCAS